MHLVCTSKAESPLGRWNNDSARFGRRSLHSTPADWGTLVWIWTTILLDSIRIYPKFRDRQNEFQFIWVFQKKVEFFKIMFQCEILFWKTPINWVTETLFWKTPINWDFDDFWTFWWVVVHDFQFENLFFFNFFK